MLGTGIIAIVALFWILSSFASGDDAGSYDATTTTRLEDQMEIVDWNWHKDPDYGTRGTIKWNVQVRNNSAKYVESVRVEFTTYNAGGGLVSTDFTFVGPIPPGGTRSREGFANLYGNEQSAQIEVSRARAEQ